MIKEYSIDYQTSWSSYYKKIWVVFLFTYIERLNLLALSPIKFQRYKDFFHWICVYLSTLLQTRKFPDWQAIKCDRSPIQYRLLQALRNSGYSHVQAEVLICGYQVDLVLKKERIAIECDGKVFHSSKEQQQRDQKKTWVLQRNGWKVIRFTGREIYQNLQGCVWRVEVETRKKRKNRYGKFR